MAVVVAGAVAAEVVVDAAAAVETSTASSFTLPRQSPSYAPW